MPPTPTIYRSYGADYFTKKGRRKHISISKQKHEQLERQAQREGVPIAHIVERDIAKALGLPAPKVRKPKGWRTN